MFTAISSLYQITIDINDWTNRHIQEMQKNENLTVARTGKILEGAKFGFGLGYIAPLAVIAAGQFLLGNPLSVVGTVASIPIFSNPIAMTCAAVGAIYYGWGALTKDEQTDVLDKLSAGLAMGAELIKSIVNYIIVTTNELLNSKNLAEIKEFVRNAANTFGRKLGEVTHAITDRVLDAMQSAKEITVTATNATTDTVMDASKALVNTASKAAGSIKSALDRGDNIQSAGGDSQRKALPDLPRKD
jgi:hypothetical protein